MMTGAYQAKDWVSKYLEHDLPTRIVAYRNFWNMSEEELPTPNGYFNYAPPSLQSMGAELPVIYTVIISTNGLTRIGYTPTFDPIYRVAYAARTYCWCRNDGIDLTARSRDNLLTLIRTSLLDDQCLQAMDHENREVKFDESSIREEYSDLMLAKGDRYDAGGYLAYELTINEVVTRPLNGTVEEFQVGTYAFLEE